MSRSRGWPRGSKTCVLRGNGCHGGNMLRVALIALALLVLAAPAQAQLLKEIKESARQKVGERKERTRAHVIQRATEPVDSALERGIRPVDSLVSQAATGAGRSVARL